MSDSSRFSARPVITIDTGTTLTMAKIVTKSPAMKTFVQNVKTLLHAYGWTHQDLADAVGVHRQHVSRVLTGDSGTISTVEAIAVALNVSLSELFSPTMEIPEKITR